MPARLEGRVAFITGVARGQGRSHAVRLAQEGADIIGIDICADIPANHYPMASRGELDDTVELVEGAGGKIVASVADVRDFHQVKAALDAGVAHFGRLDIVCANAGIAPVAFRELTIEEELEQWRAATGVILDGSYHTASAAIPHLIAGQRGGSIVFTSSTAGLKGFGGLQGGGLGYAAAKHGIVGLMRTLANALAPAQYSGQHRAPDCRANHDGGQSSHDRIPGALPRGWCASAESNAHRHDRTRGRQCGHRLSGFR